jgi:propionyl-CoA carboxylase alpha chain
MQHPRWREGRLSTAFIAEEYPDGFERPTPSLETLRRAALVATTIEIARKARLDRHIDRLRVHSGAIQRDWVAKIDGDYLDLAVALDAGRVGGPVRYRIGVAETECVLETDYAPGQSPWIGTIDGEELSAQVRSRENVTAIFVDGLWVEAKVLSPAIAALDRLMPEKLPPDTSKMLLCPMPGLVVSVAVSEGQAVKAGETLAVVEAMKMENVLRAERDATVTRLNAKPGDSLAVDAVIMEFE